MTEFDFGSEAARGFSRRRLLKLGGGVAGATLMPAFVGQVGRAYADDKPAIGTWPAGAAGDSVTIGATVPRTGAYAVRATTSSRGCSSPSTTSMKTIPDEGDRAESGQGRARQGGQARRRPTAPPNQTRRFRSSRPSSTRTRSSLMTGSTSSAVAVALNKFAAAREDSLRGRRSRARTTRPARTACAIGFRQNFYGETAANAIGPVLVKTYGKNRKAAFMTPDYTYGHTVTKSVNDYLTSQGGWTQVTDQVSPLGTQDFSQYLTNIANSGAEFIINVNWGRDAVLSTQQAKQFGLTPKMKMVIPYQIPFLAKEVGSRTHRRRFRRHRLLVDARGQIPFGQDVRRGLPEEIRLPARMGRRERLHAASRIWARMVSEAGTFYPPDVIKQYEKGETFPSLVGDVHYRPEDHQCVRPVIIVRGKAPKDMKNPRGLLGGARSGAGRAADAEAGRLRLQAWRLHLTEPNPFSALPCAEKALQPEGGRAEWTGSPRIFRPGRFTPRNSTDWPVIGERRDGKGSFIGSRRMAAWSTGLISSRNVSTGWCWARCLR